MIEVVAMMTALSVRVPEPKKGLRGWAEKLRGDRIEVKTCRARGVTLRHVIYTSYSGTVKLEKADEVIGMQRDRLLCSDKLEFPPSSGYRRFCSDAFAARLCTNFALGLLSDCAGAGGMRTAIYDPAAAYAELLPYVLERCGDVSVVTDCYAPYLDAADCALQELGAAAVITRRREELSDRELIIAPAPVRELLPVSQRAVILTVSRPPVAVSGRAYWCYRFRTPNGFADIKPEELSEEYFCSALYTLAAQYELGSTVPLAAQGDSGELRLPNGAP